MDDKLTNEDKTFVKEIVEHGNQTEAAKKAYKIKNYGYARVKGHEQLTKTNIKNAIQTLADRIPDDLVIEKHIALLNKTDEKGEIDVQAVKAGVDMTYKLKGVYANDPNKPPTNLNLVLVQFLDKQNNGDTNETDNH